MLFSSSSKEDKNEFFLSPSNGTHYYTINDDNLPPPASFVTGLGLSVSYSSVFFGVSTQRKRERETCKSREEKKKHTHTHTQQEKRKRNLSNFFFFAGSKGPTFTFALYLL